MPTDYNEKKYSQVKQTYRSFYECVMRKCNNENLEPISIFTTNYDLFNEYSLEDNNIEYTTGFDQKIVRIFNPKNFHYRIVDAENRYKNQWMPVNKFVKLFKLHGSVNWKYADGKIVQNDKLSYSENIIIYPSINKHFETVQSPYSELFREFSICLQKPSTTLVVIGYGFSDDHINNLIVQNLNNRDFTLIVFGKESIIESNFYSLNKDKVNLHIIYGEIDGKWAHHLDVIVEKYLVDNMSGSTNAETGCFEHEV